MASIPEADIDYVKLKNAKIGDIFFSKPHWYKKGKWIVKDIKDCKVFNKKYVALGYQINLLYPN